MNETIPFTIGQAAKALGCKHWQVRRIYQRGLLPEPARFGAFRVVFHDQMPMLKQALTKAGYLGLQSA